ncbi:MAG: triose-phosphate isomerase [Clostridiales bacterium]|nr:triose-phosphate isomerase [Clostridiales bacterium]MBS5877706.1 triose-phosphate isomerase [Clostridiales bacterium]MDU0939615.1 triose-phosphate isomerase [Clostridiales bacterium]MDU1042538.1 triose-phosphate isomerase [Clostridiales bacterium]
MRKTVVAANWKMNMTPSQGTEFLDSILDEIKDSEAEVHIIPPFICIPEIVDIVSGTDIIVGAQNLYFEEKGAFTGEVSGAMLKDAGCGSVIIGHSERRSYFNETDEVINLKLKKALEHELIPILCCGESLETRKTGDVGEFIEGQVGAALHGISKTEAEGIIIAYEPIWAIGTGEVASSNQAEEVCAIIRKKIEELYDAETAGNITILYGGSVNASNCLELFGCPDIDGGLIGSAGLMPEFIDIVKCGG